MAVISDAQSPQISVGIPVYNNERYLEQSLRSTCAQTYDDFEVVICDNASDDRTGQICQDYAARDKRIRYFRNEVNIGGARNFNRVFQLCRGKYHKWSPADDFVDTTLLGKAKDVLDKDPEVVLCYPKTTLINENGEIISHYEDNLHLQHPFPSQRFIQLLNTIGLCHAHLGLIRREILSRSGLFGDEQGCDVHLLAELSLYGKFFVLPELLYFRRYHVGSSSWNRHDDDRQQSYYDPKRKTYFGMQTWKKYHKLVAVVERAPIGASEKWRLFRYLGRQIRWDRATLGREILERWKHGADSLMCNYRQFFHCNTNINPEHIEAAES